MEKTRIVEPQQGPDNRILFVAGTRDRIEPEISLLQFACRNVKQSACQLILEDCLRAPAVNDCSRFEDAVSGSLNGAVLALARNSRSFA